MSVDMIVGGLIVFLFFGTGSLFGLCEPDRNGKIIAGMNATGASVGLGYAVYGIAALL